jgi:hypothetical protein
MACDPHAKRIVREIEEDRDSADELALVVMRTRQSVVLAQDTEPDYSDSNRLVHTDPPIPCPTARVKVLGFLFATHFPEQAPIPGEA